MQCALTLQLLHRRRAVQLRQSRLDLREMLAVLGAYRPQLRLERICDELLDAVSELDILDIELISDDIRIEAVEARLGYHVQIRYRLAVLYVSLVSRRTSEHHDVQHLVHGGLQILVHHSRIDIREVAQMHRLRRGLVHAAHEILIYLLRHERDHRCSRLGSRHQRRIQRHVGIDLVLLHALRPVAVAAAPYVPVAHVIDEGLQLSARLGYPVVGEVVVHIAHHRVQT